jgi:DNA-binding MarR family transcriptional regulator
MPQQNKINVQEVVNMQQYKHTPFDEEILEAMIAHNTNIPSKDQFTLIDARIISLIHSYAYSGLVFFASNKYLAEKCFTTPATIQKSINRLIAHNLIEKIVCCHKGRKQRTLIYNEDAANEFKMAAPQITPPEAP